MNRDDARLLDRAVTAAVVHSQEQVQAADEQIDVARDLMRRAQQSLNERRPGDAFAALFQASNLAMSAALRIEAAMNYRRGAESVAHTALSGEIVQPEGPGVRAILR